MIIRRAIVEAVWVFLVVLTAMAFPHGVGSAQETPLKVTAIEVRGNKRIDESIIRGRLTLKPDEPYSSELIRDQLKLVYDMGFFEDVQIETEPIVGGVVVVVSVKEKPFIAEIVFDGNEELSDDKLQEKITVRGQSFLDQRQVKESAEKVKQAYQDDGFYNAQVVPIIQSVSEDRKRLTFYIKEGDRTKIETVDFPGARVVTKKELLKVMANREKVFLLSLWTDAGILKQEELQNDAERIKEVYMNKGYLNVQVSQPTIELTEDKEGLKLTFTVIEGEPYTWEEVAYRGNVIFEEAELRVGSKVIPGEVFQRVALREEVVRVTDLYGEKGYSFANVVPSISTDPEAKTAILTLNIEEGALMKIRRIRITGNDKTRDNVIRRELRVEEQQVIDTVGLRRSFQRLNNLNYFETVEILPKQVDKDEVDLEVKVKEKPTGSFSVGGGFSTLDQFVAIANVSEGNLFGRGYTVRVRGQLGQRRTLGLITLRDPSFRDSGVSLMASAFSTNTNFLTYEEERIGGSLTTGRPFSEFVRGSVTLFGEILDISNPAPGASQLILEQVGRQSSTGFRTTLVRDTRDFFLDPRTGWRHLVNFDYATPLLGGTNHFYKVFLDSLKYTPLFWDTRHMIRGRVGIVDGIGEKPTPVGELFFVGGINTMRGFKFGQAGPVTVDGDPQGATRELIINNEFIFPISAEAKLNGVLFFDYGEGFDSFDDIKLLDLKKSAGIEGRWISPFGPLRAAWGFVIDPEPGQRKSVFEFSVGSIF